MLYFIKVGFLKSVSGENYYQKVKQNLPNDKNNSNNNVHRTNKIKSNFKFVFLLEFSYQELESLHLLTVLM